MTFAEVEGRLIEAVELWRRSPGGGRSPFAGDGPWELLTERTRADAGGGYLGRGEVEAAALRRLPLSRAEVARRDEASAWLTMIDESERRVVIAAIHQLAAGRARIDWMGMKARLGIARGAGALAMRYERAVGFIAFRLNGKGEKLARALSRRQGQGWEQVMARAAWSGAGLEKSADARPERG
jgi:hypothetical protein